MYLYHYSRKKLDKLKTRDLQNKQRLGRNNGGRRYSRSQEISFFINKLPFEIINKAKFPDNHIYKDSKYLYCHYVKLEDLKEIFEWELVETPLDVLLRNNFWLDNKYYKKIYNKVRLFLKSIKKEKSTKLEDLEQKIKNYKNTYEFYFKNWIESEDFKKTKNMYACGVPHIIVFTDKPIKVSKVEKVTR